MVPGLLWLQLAGSRVHGFSSYPWHVIPRDLSSPARDPTLSPALEDRFLTLNLQGSPATVPFKHMIGYTWVIEYRCVATTTVKIQNNRLSQMFPVSPLLSIPSPTLTPDQPSCFLSLLLCSFWSFLRMKQNTL